MTSFPRRVVNIRLEDVVLDELVTFNEKLYLGGSDGNWHRVT